MMLKDSVPSVLVTGLLNFASLRDGLERMVSAKQDSLAVNEQISEAIGIEFTLPPSGTSISTNTWVHAAVVRDGTTISYYAAGSRLDNTIDADDNTY